MDAGRIAWKVGRGQTYNVGQWRWSEPETNMIGRMGAAYRSLLAIHDRRTKGSTGKRVAALLDDEIEHRRIARQAVADLKVVEQARLLAGEAFDHSVEHRLKLKPFEIDPHDAAAALARTDIRRAIAAMPTAKATAYVNGLQGDQRVEVLAAVLEVPGIVSGIGEATWSRLREQELERQHPAAFRDLQELEAARVTLERAVNASWELVKRQTIDKLRLQAGDFREIASQAEHAAV